MGSDASTQRSKAWWIARVAVLSLLLAGCQSAQDGGDDEPATPGAAASPTASPPASPTDQATIVVVDSSHGPILADSSGRTVYMFTNDGSESVCYDECATRWPPLLAKGEPQAGNGTEASLLGTTKRRDGSMQVTYKGHPLYHFSADQAAGDTKGQGVGGVWYVVSPQGEPIR